MAIDVQSMARHPSNVDMSCLLGIQPYSYNNIASFGMPKCSVSARFCARGRQNTAITGFSSSSGGASLSTVRQMRKMMLQ